MSPEAFINENVGSALATDGSRAAHAAMVTMQIVQQRPTGRTRTPGVGRCIDPNRGELALSRSQVHRLLRDEFYVGTVTLNRVKREGRHDPLIDRETFEQVQAVLSAHRKSGDRSHKHLHHLRGSLYCTCGRRLGYGRHKSKAGRYYEYFSCLSRVTRGGRCSSPYFPVDRVEEAIERHHESVLLSRAE